MDLHAEVFELRQALMIMPSLAVCVTGLERSFKEIRSNIEQAVLSASGYDKVLLFGVRPSNDPWKTALGWPFTAVATQRLCVGEEALPNASSFYPFDYSGPSGRTVRHFVLELCDLEACEALIASHEQRRGVAFDAVARLRLDMAWEATLRLPTPDAPSAELALSAFDSRRGGVREWVHVCACTPATALMPAHRPAAADCPAPRALRQAAHGELQRRQRQVRRGRAECYAQVPDARAAARARLAARRRQPARRVVVGALPARRRLRGPRRRLLAPPTARLHVLPVRRAARRALGLAGVHGAAARAAAMRALRMRLVRGRLPLLYAQLRATAAAAAAAATTIAAAECRRSAAQKGPTPSPRATLPRARWRE